MRKLAILLLAAGIALPAVAAKRVTVEQLGRLLAADHGKPDGRVAQQLLAGLELTERVSASGLSRWEAALPGAESRRSLLVLADLSAFLGPPAAEIPNVAIPDLTGQRRIMAQAVDYATKTIHQLPNFFATRDTIRFEDRPPGQSDAGSMDGTFTAYQPLHPVARSSARVFYRDGQEVVDSDAAKNKNHDQPEHGLITSGVFGPILGTVLVDAAHGNLSWSHWETGANGPEAVFQFSIPMEKSHYEVEFCCVTGDYKNGIFQQFPGYHGEIAVDPVRGTILRLTLEADLKPADPLLRSDILVEYGPVEIGGRTYTCPLKSVSITLAREHFQTLLNDVVFAQYHLFRSESRILTGADAEPDANPPASNPTDAKNSVSLALDVQPVEAAPAAATNAPITPPAPMGASTPVPAPMPAPEAAAPEIEVAASAKLPELPVSEPVPSTNPSFTLHVTTRLVDVGVVAFDKKGHPVTNLKPENFEIYDNGRKQAVRFFSQASGAAAEESAKEPGPPGDAPGQLVFTNRRAEVADAKPAAGATESSTTILSTTILLIDPGNLGWADLTYARAEMLRFLRSLPAKERVGLYVMNAQGFQVLEEGTADHAVLVSKLSGWMPSAQDLAQAQEKEQRNRQQFDEVVHASDLENVNGNMPTDSGANMVDPQLRENGGNPGRSALLTLAGVARHLAAIPGHKNLVWVTSDNVLADWSDKAVGSDRGSKPIDGYVLRAQEALNDAHVSVYPLDASQLETNAEDPSLQNRNIELSPSVTAPPGPQSGGAAPGRIAAEVQQDLHPVQAAIQLMAEATGGNAFRRSGDIAAALDEVVADGRAAYLLGFTPDTQADDRYHLLTVKLAGRRGVTLRYRMGYEFTKEPTALKDRFQQAIWQSDDVSEIAVSARTVAASEGSTLKLEIAANDLAMEQQGDRWKDRLDIFLVRRDDGDLQAQITGQTLSLTLKPATYAKMLQAGIPFDQFVEKTPDTGSVRMIVVDENSDRIGSVTLPAAALQRAH